MTPPGPEHPPRRLVQIAWFVGLWLAGLGVVGVIAYAIRSVLL